ncbi:MAG: hypothetical protein R2744_12920 [Bacteroidales bacterium]
MTEHQGAAEKGANILCGSPGAAEGAETGDADDFSSNDPEKLAEWFQEHMVEALKATRTKE